MIVTESHRTRGWSGESGGAMKKKVLYRQKNSPKPNDPGYHQYWFGVGLTEHFLAVQKAVLRKRENLRAISVADTNYRNYLIANIHKEDFQNILLDALELWNN